MHRLLLPRLLSQSLRVIARDDSAVGGGRIDPWVETERTRTAECTVTRIVFYPMADRVMPGFRDSGERCGTARGGVSANRLHG